MNRPTAVAACLFFTACATSHIDAALTDPDLGTLGAALAAALGGLYVLLAIVTFRIADLRPAEQFKAMVEAQARVFADMGDAIAEIGAAARAPARTPGVLPTNLVVGEGANDELAAWERCLRTEYYAGDLTVWEFEDDYALALQRWDRDRTRERLERRAALERKPAPKAATVYRQTKRTGGHPPPKPSTSRHYAPPPTKPPRPSRDTCRACKGTGVVPFGSQVTRCDACAGPGERETL